VSHCTGDLALLAADTPFRVDKNGFHAFTSFLAGRDELPPGRNSIGLFF
jgi:hypothetical protein